MQTKRGMDAGAFTGAKSDLRKRLDDLRNELDEYLSGEYGVKTDDEAAYQQWRDSHQPHWFVEFYGIMHKGGFDAVIGNPPYVSPGKVSDSWTPMRYRTHNTKNLYALCMERAMTLEGHVSRYGMIIPVSLVSGDGYQDIAGVLFPKRTSWVSHDSNRPGQLFHGVEQRLTIF